MSFQKILVALDDSQLSKVVFNRALEMAQAHHARMMLLHCLTQEMIGEPPLAALPVELGLYPELIDNAYQAEHLRVEQRIEQVQGMLGEYCKTAAALEVPTEFDYKIGDAGECLCQVAKNWGSDVIVLGRRGRTGWAEALLGSVSNYVVHRAPCSVLVIQQAQMPESMVL